MSNLCGNIANGIAFDCNKVVLGGVEQDWVLLNHDDIDRDASVTDRTGTTHKITHLQLKSGMTGYLIKGIPAKKNMGWTSSLNQNDDDPDDFTHGVNMRVYELTEEVMAWLNSLGKGANVVAVFKNRDLGINGKDKYTVVGYDMGLKISEMNLSSIDNKASTPIVLTSRYDNEPSLPLKYFDTDLATSDTAFEALFA